MTRVSKNFTLEELRDSATAKKLGIINAPGVDEVCAMCALVHNVLQPLRDAMNEPIKIGSGYRCAKLNTAVGGVSNSQHTKGEAADIDTGNHTESYRLARIAKTTPAIMREIDQMILYPTFVHFSHKLKGRNRQQILYNKSYKGQKIKK